MNRVYGGTNTILLHCCNAYYKSILLGIFFPKSLLSLLCVTNLSSMVYLSWAVDKINIIIIAVSNNANVHDLQRKIL